jgi:hypothetical protein
MAKTTPTHKAGDDALRAMVLDHFPQAQLTFEIAQALQPHLPLKTIDQAERALQNVKVAGHTLGAGTISQFASAELLPVNDAADLVRKVAGMLGIAMQLGRSGGALMDPGARIIADLDRMPGSRSRSIPALHFVGPSIFGYTLAKKGARS